MRGCAETASRASKTVSRECGGNAAFSGNGVSQTEAKSGSMPTHASIKNDVQTPFADSFGGSALILPYPAPYPFCLSAGKVGQPTRVPLIRGQTDKRRSLVATESKKFVGSEPTPSSLVGASTPR